MTDDHHGHRRVPPFVPRGRQQGKTTESLHRALLAELRALRDAALPPYPDGAAGGGDFHYQLEHLLDLVDLRITELARELGEPE